VLSSLITLASELSPSKHRGWYITIVGGFWTLGSIFIAFLAFILFGRNNYSWRIFVLIAASPTLLGGVLVYAFVPESPRFLALHGRYQDAANVANHVAASMGYIGKQLTIAEIRDHYGHLVEGKNDLTRKNDNAMKKIRDLYGKNLLLHTTLPLQIVWFSMSFGSVTQCIACLIAFCSNNTHNTFCIFVGVDCARGLQNCLRRLDYLTSTYRVYTLH
jgi:MFS family permease